MTRRSSHLPLFALGTLLLLVGEFCLGGLAHSASHRHRYCSEHGAFEEASKGAAVGSTHGSAGGVEQGSDAPEADHDRCPFAPAGQTSRIASGPAWVAPLDPPADSAPPVALSRGFTPVDALACAPKASPPAA